MPSGRTHDRITLYTLPAITAIAGWFSRSAAIALAVGATYLFAGLMFGGDLDTRSHQYNRWLWLRWIWLPYRRHFRHRSWWTHGPIVGTAVRLIYLGIWVGLPALAIAYAGHHLLDWRWTPSLWLTQTWRWLQSPAGGSGYSVWEILAAIVIGLECGSLSHSCSDWIGSAIGRWQKRWKRR